VVVLELVGLLVVGFLVVGLQLVGRVGVVACVCLAV
jgi:hypothetical protein